MLNKKVKSVLEYAIIVLLGLLLATNYSLFITENNFAPAGINGICVMIQYKLHFSIGYMSLIINTPLCILAYFFVNKKFAIKTFVFCVCYSLFYLVQQQTNVFKDFVYNAEGIDTVYPVGIAGILSGFINGILFKFNSCTGGTDIVSKWVSKKNPYLNFFWITFYINTIVAFASCFVYAEGAGLNYKPACLCILYCFVTSFLANKMIKGSKSAYQFIIITDDVADLEQEILTVLHHSVTRLQGVGAYTNTNKQVLMCVVNRHQLVDFKAIIKRHPNTFTYVQTVYETIGNFRTVK